MNKDNQQQTVNDFEIGWLAGIIEGEGTIGLQIHKRNGRSQQMRVTPRIIISNTDKEIIEKCVSILDGLGVGKWVRSVRQNNKKLSDLMLASGANAKNFKDCYGIHIEGFKRLKRLLSIIMPSFYGEKRKRALAMHKLIETRLEKCRLLGVGSNLHYDQEDVNNMLDFLRLTRTTNYEKISGMLNEYTRGKHYSKRLMMYSDLTGNRERTVEIQPAA